MDFVGLQRVEIGSSSILVLSSLALEAQNVDGALMGKMAIHMGGV